MRSINQKHSKVFIRRKSGGFRSVHNSRGVATQRDATNASTRCILFFSDPSCTKYSYDAFGKTVGVSKNSNGLRYVGQYGVDSDDTIGLQYMWNRWYDPDLGRFIGRDPIGFRGGLNLYRYARNNPLRWMDPLGLTPAPTVTPLPTFLPIPEIVAQIFSPTESPSPTEGPSPTATRSPNPTEQAQQTADTEFDQLNTMLDSVPVAEGYEGINGLASLVARAIHNAWPTATATSGPTVTPTQLPSKP